MTMAVPVQEFQIGQRVRRDNGHAPFVITTVWFDGERFLYAEFLGLDTWYFSSDLTLAPGRLPYEPSERRTLTRRETDAEMAARHAAERAQYDAQGEGE